MDMQALHTFATVAQQGSVTAAAHTLHTVPSNVTARIRALEQQIGLPLFERYARGMRLTAAGHRLLPYAAQMERLLKEALEQARDDGIPRGVLQLGSMETTAAVRLPALLARYHAACPEVDLRVQTGTSAELLQAVLAGQLDGALVAGNIRHAQLHVQAVFQEELVLVTPATVRSLRAVRALHDSPAGLHAWMFRAGCSYRQHLEEWLAQQGMHAFARMELGTLDGILGCVAAGLGITLVPASVLALQGRAHGLRRHATGLFATTHWVVRRQPHVPAALRQFAALLPVPKSAPSGAPQ